MGMFHIQLQIYSLLSLASDVLEGLPCVYLWITGWASKYTLYAVVCSPRFLRSGNFSAEIKKLYRLHRRRVQLPKWSMAVIWRSGTELRHFDQETWGGNNCDMLVFTVDESRDISFLSVSIVHFTVNILWQKHHLSLRCSLSRIQSNLSFERGKSLLISSLFLGAQLRLNITKTAPFRFVSFLWWMLVECASLVLVNFTIESSWKLADLSIFRGIPSVATDYTARAAKAEWSLALPLSLP